MGNLVTATDGVGNTASDPLFVGPAAGNYKLQGGSPCFNKGFNLPWMLVAGAKDLAGEQRVWKGTVDMGAYEIPPDEPGLLFMLK